MLTNPWLTIALYTFMLTVGQALFKVAALQTKFAGSDPLALSKQLLGTPTFLVACLLYAVSTVIWVSLMARLPLSTAYPVVIAISIILTTLLGVIVFKEPLTSQKIIGLMVVIAGVKIVSSSLT